MTHQTPVTIAARILVISLLIGSVWVERPSAQLPVHPIQPVRPLPAAPQALLWRDPGSVATRDLFWGMGGPSRAPQGPFTFVEEDAGGTQPKIVVKDARGWVWDIKFGKEAHSEVAANRFVWALGYLTEEIYFVREGTVQGASGLKRAAEFVRPGGGFADGRFKRRDPQMERTDEPWTFKENPFVGSKELSGLRILMTMINNWDIRGDRNNRVLRVPRPDGSHDRWFIVSDLGATFGKMGGLKLLTGHSKWNVEDFEKERFIEKVEPGEIHLDYDGWDSGLDRVSVDHARWFAAFACQLTPEQVRRAFEAGGATPEEVDRFSKKMLGKIAELQAIAGQED
jgi:hypothetical protein